MNMNYFSKDFKEVVAEHTKSHSLKVLRERFKYLSFLQKELLSGDSKNILVDSLSYKVSKTEANITKNRYSNIFPYDYNRVYLRTSRKPSAFDKFPDLYLTYIAAQLNNTFIHKKTIKDLGIDETDITPGTFETPENVGVVHGQCTQKSERGDYINASWIFSPKTAGTQEFIAAQAPINNSISDFWVMVYERKVPLIVMLANLIERGAKKCEQYWPELPGESLILEKEGLHVRYNDLQEILDGAVLIRSFSITSQDTSTNNGAKCGTQSTSHTVFQLHYVNWDDGGVPETFEETMNVLNIVPDLLKKGKDAGILDLSKINSNSKNSGAEHANNIENSDTKDSHGPIVVHCSAGCGRTVMRLNNTSDCVAASVEDLLAFYNTNSSTGLSSQDARARVNSYGLNVLARKDEESLFVKFFTGIFTNPMVLLLLGSSVVSVIVGNYDDAFSITLAILIVSVVGFVQEYKSEQTLKALNDLVPHYCNVVRDGANAVINADSLVPGDIVIFSTGDRIPADIKLIEAVHLEIDESSLSGESESRFKTVTRTDSSQTVQSQQPSYNNFNADLSFSDQYNIGFMGTLVRNGNGKGVVIFTGSNTEFGKIHSMLNEIEEPRTPLQQNMDKLGAQLSITSFIVIGAIMLIGLIQRKGWMNMFTIGVSLAVAAIPEGLSIVVTVTLAVGVFKMAKRKAICKKLPSVETLGSTSVICVDKTGTLTMNKMEVQYLYTVSEGLVSISPDSTNKIFSSWSYSQLLKVGNMCNNAKLNAEGSLIGQATDIAMLNIALKIRNVDERDRFSRISEIPFNSENKKMSVVYPSFADQEFAQDLGNRLQSRQSSIVYVKGALESIIELCTTHYSSLGKMVELTDTIKNEIFTHAEHLSHRGLRVVATAMGSTDNVLSFVGFHVMKDPPRPGVENTVRSLIKAGLRVVMITGDSGKFCFFIYDTALAIASSVGILVSSGTYSYMTGTQLDNISDIELSQRIRNVSVFARTTPRHKVKIVRALQSIGEVVGMTGDGVNDAPALRLADIGISMGLGGTEVAKEASDLILVNDDLSTILAAIEEGKSIFSNIQNFLTFQLSTSVAALSLVALSTTFGLPNPLNAMQILWINILMDGPPAQSLGVEPPDAQVMSRPPRPKNDPILSTIVIKKILVSAFIILSGTMFIYVSEMQDGVVTARDTTMTFTTFVFFDLFNAFSCRSATKSVNEIGVFSNVALNYAVIASFLGQLGVIYLPFLQSIFQTEPLSLFDLLKLILLSSSVLFVNEIMKNRDYIVSKFWPGKKYQSVNNPRISISTFDNDSLTSIV
ncbi:hypothetical protein BB561_003440 [Smittium simulii]|uniref:Calcium-transporting ATPase n=1 Tax=Smittium simulii TaxID=133385 RepID=A0A2T9YLB9_9FUNG|nr:hypothetical protein BB561_003440 [Smittium simulii]